MFKIYIDSRLRKKSVVSLYKKVLLVWLKKDTAISESDPADAVEEILKRNNLSPRDISNFEVFSGPGSYTGLKMGHAVGNTLNWTLKDVSARELPLPEYGSEPNITPPKSDKKY